MKRYMYLLERIKDSYDWPKGITIWANHKCPGWRVLKKIKID